MGKASAVAFPIQGLSKYHGLRDPVRRIPYHDSISLCTGPIHSRTTVEVLSRGEASSVVIDGAKVTGRALQRVTDVVNEVRVRVQDWRPFRMESRNDFPQYVGLGSSSSGFAALALAAAKAYGWDASLDNVSEIARVGAGSATRAVTGGISEWVTEAGKSFGRQLVSPDELQDWRIIVPLVRHEEPTENVHAEVVRSPFFDARNQYMASALAEMRVAVASKDVRCIAPLAEKDTLNLHAVALAGGRITWLPVTLEVMQCVQALRKGGVDAWFSIDTGATPYVNTTRDSEQDAFAALDEIEGITEFLRLRPAGSAVKTHEHLF